MASSSRKQSNTTKQPTYAAAVTTKKSPFDNNRSPPAPITITSAASIIADIAIAVSNTKAESKLPATTVKKQRNRNRSSSNRSMSVSAIKGIASDLSKGELKSFRMYLFPGMNSLSCKDFGERSLNETGFKVLVIESLRTIFSLSDRKFTITSSKVFSHPSEAAAEQICVDIVVELDDAILIFELKYLQLAYMIKTSLSSLAASEKHNEQEKLLEIWKSNLNRRSVKFAANYKKKVNGVKATTTPDKTLADAIDQLSKYRELIKRTHAAADNKPVFAFAIVGAVNTIFTDTLNTEVVPIQQSQTTE